MKYCCQKTSRLSISLGFLIAIANCGQDTSLLNPTANQASEDAASDSLGSWDGMMAIGAMENADYATTFCTTTVITPFHLLTSASCLTHYNAIVRPVEVFLEVMEDGVPTRKVFSVANIVLHENFGREKSLFHDVAVVTTALPMPVVPAKLAFQGGSVLVQNGDEGFVATYGFEDPYAKTKISYRSIHTVQLEQVSDWSLSYECVLEADTSANPAPTCLNQNERGTPYFWAMPDTQTPRIIAVHSRNQNMGDTSRSLGARVDTFNYEWIESAVCDLGPCCKSTDVFLDGWVDIQDFSSLRAKFGQQADANERADINNDGMVDIMDFSLFKADFGKLPSFVCN